uniref:CSON015570 protein n=1 Tax=Culicoides sonorensis TaxID=179676 RepID=A0A336KV89_CULSO
MLNVNFSTLIRIGSILYGLLQFSLIIDVLLEPEETLKYCYGAFYLDIQRYVEISVLMAWYIVFVPVLNLLLIVGVCSKNPKLTQIYLLISYFSMLISLPTTFMAIVFVNVYSISRARDLLCTIFWLASIHELTKKWNNKNNTEIQDEIEEIL